MTKAATAAKRRVTTKPAVPSELKESGLILPGSPLWDKRGGWVGDRSDPSGFAESERQKILKVLGDISGYEVMWDRVLVACYKAPNRKDLGAGKAVYRPDQSQDEDVYQGTIGLVIGKGPYAYLDANWKPYDQSIHLHDWVIFRRGYGTRQKIRGVDCIMFEKPIDAIQGRIKTLDIVDVM